MADWDEDWTGTTGNFVTTKPYFADLIDGLNERILIYRSFRDMSDVNVLSTSFDNLETMKRQIFERIDAIYREFVKPEAIEGGSPILKSNSQTDITTRDQTWYYDTELWTEAEMLTELGDTVLYDNDNMVATWIFLFQKWKMLNLMIYIPHFQSFQSDSNNSLTRYRGQGSDANSATAYNDAIADYQAIAASGTTIFLRLEDSTTGSFDSEIDKIGITNVGSAHLDGRAELSPLGLRYTVSATYSSLFQDNNWNSSDLPIPNLPQSATDATNYRVYGGDDTTTIRELNVGASFAVDVSGLHDVTSNLPKPDDFAITHFAELQTVGGFTFNAGETALEKGSVLANWNSGANGVKWEANP